MDKYHDMIRRIIIFAVLSVSFAMLIIFFQARRLPADSKLCGDHWLKCYMVNQGLYNLRIYSKDKKFIKEQAFMLPYKYWRRDQKEITGKIEKYDGDTICLDKGVKLLACSVPLEAEMVRSVDGLVWVKYEPLGEEKNSFVCEVFSTKDGSLVSSGAYALKKYHWDNKKNRTVYEKVQETVKLCDLNYYGGVSICLKNKMALMPDGVIDYNTSTHAGLRVKYDKDGNEIEREEY